jgi:hypothetical protein
MDRRQRGRRQIDQTRAGIYAALSSVHEERYKDARAAAFISSGVLVALLLAIIFIV